MSDIRGSKEFVKDLIEPEKRLFNFVMQQLSHEMDRSSRLNQNWLRALADIKRAYQAIVIDAVADGLKYRRMNAVRPDQPVKSAMDLISQKRGGMKIHHCYSVQNYAVECLREPLKSDNRFGYKLEIHHWVPLAYKDCIDEWNFPVKPDKNLSSILNAVRVRFAGMVYRKSAVGHPENMGKVITSTVDAFCDFIVASHESLEHVSYKRHLLKDPHRYRKETYL